MPICKNNGRSDTQAMSVKWSVSEAATHAGISREKMRLRLKAAGHATERGARFSPAEVIAAMIGSYDAERTRETRERADKLQLENAEKRKELVTMADAIEVAVAPWEPVARMVKDMPARLSTRCNPGDPVLAREVLDAYAREIVAAIEARLKSTS